MRGSRVVLQVSGALFERGVAGEQLEGGGQFVAEVVETEIHLAHQVVQLAAFLRRVNVVLNPLREGGGHHQRAHHQGGEDDPQR